MELYQTKSVGDRTEEVNLCGPRDQPLAVAAIPVFREVRRRPVRVESCVVDIHFVEQKDFGVVGRTMHSVEQTARFRTSHRCRLLDQQRGERVSHIRRGTQPGNHYGFVRHVTSSSCECAVKDFTRARFTRFNQALNHSGYDMTSLKSATLLIALLVCSVTITHAQMPQRIAGEIVAVQGPELRVKDRAGQLVTLRLGDRTMITARMPATLDAIASGSYIGTTATPRPDGALTASEVHVFSESMRGSGEGHRPMDRLPGSTMTNATVTSVTPAAKSAPRSTMTNATVASVTGKEGSRRIVLKYSGGEQTVLVDRSVSVTRMEPGDARMLVPGARVAIGASRQSDGTLAADRITVGLNGYVPLP